MKKGVLSLLSFVGGSIAGISAAGSLLSKQVREKKKYADKHLAIMLVMNQWIINKQEGKSLVSFFEENGYKSIAIYGMSYAGETLIDELKNTNVEVVYGIDRRSESLYADIDIVSIDDSLENVDAVVVTAITFFDEIEEILCEKLDCPIISLEDVLYEV